MGEASGAEDGSPAGLASRSLRPTDFAPAFGRAVAASRRLRGPRLKRVLKKYFTAEMANGPGLKRVLKKGLLFLEGRLERGAEA
jgi:hypothetical protein